MDGTGFECRQKQEIYSLSKTFRRVLSTICLPIRWLSDVLHASKMPGRETNYNPYQMSKLRMNGAIYTLPNTPFWLVQG
jgi:hypothetical protein